MVDDLIPDEIMMNLRPPTPPPVNEEQESLAGPSNSSSTISNGTPKYIHGK